MRNLNVIAATLLFFFFAFTSCQKENLQDLETTATITNERALPTGGIHFVNEAVQTEASAEITRQTATSRSRGITSIDCNTDYDGCTIGQGNTLEARHYPSCVRDLGASFSGEDQLFYLVVPETPEAIVTYDIALTGMSADLDLFLFALDGRGTVKDCKAISINSDTSNELLTVTDLNPGAYLVIVDGYKAGIASHFNLSVACSAVSANPPTSTYVSGLTNISVGEKYEDGHADFGSFVKKEGTTWNEYGTLIPHFPLDSDYNKAKYTFQEVAQDEWSIYLRDDSRGVNIQLDLYRHKVVYSDDEGNAFDLYDIISEY